MKTARLVVLAVALAAGGGAMFLVGGGQKTPPQVPVAIAPPPPLIETEDVLVAKRELPLGTVVADADIGWVTWPRAAVGTGMLTRKEQPDIATDLKGAVTRGNF